jgi:hypothetical protein
MVRIINGQVVYEGGESMPAYGTKNYNIAARGIIPGMEYGAAGRGENNLTYDFSSQPSSQLRSKLPGETAEQYADFIRSSPFLISDDSSGSGYRLPTQQDYDSYSQSYSQYYTPDQLQEQSLQYLINNTTPTPQFNLPQVGSAIPGMENFPWLSEYLTELYKNKNKEKDKVDRTNSEYEKLAFQAVVDKAKSPILSKIFNAPTEEQNRLEGFQRLGFNEPQMFQEKQAALAAVNATNTQLQKMRAQMDTQIAKETDRIAPSGVIDNRIAKIQRNYAPQINSLTAQHAAQTASLAQMNQLYSDVNASVDKYVQARSQEKRDNYEYIKIIDEQVSPYMSMLDDRIKMEWEQKKLDSANALKKSEDDAKAIMQMTIDAANKGIQLIPKPNATVEDVAAQYAQMVGSQPQTSGSTVGSDTTGYTNVVRDQYGNVVRTQPIRGAVGGVVGGDVSNFLDIMQESINAGDSPEVAARTAAAISEQSGISVDQKTLNDWTSQARKLEKKVAPVATSEVTTTSEIEQSIQNVKRIPGMGNSDVRATLRKQGYSQKEIDASSVGTSTAGGFIDSISNWIFK